MESEFPHAYDVIFAHQTKQEEEKKNDEGKKNSVISFDGMVMQV